MWSKNPESFFIKTYFFQTDDKKFLNQLAYDKRHLEKLLHKLTEQKDTLTKFHGHIQKQVIKLVITKRLSNINALPNMLDCGFFDGLLNSVLCHIWFIKSYLVANLNELESNS